MISDIIDDIARNSNIKANDGDYLVDGLLYCGKCKTAKQVRLELFGEVKTPYCLCKCEGERRDREEKERKEEERRAEVMRMRSYGFPQAEMKDWTFANDDRNNEKITNIALNYVEHFEEMKKNGKGLLFYGSVGTGKTYISACIANALIDKGYPCLVTNFARLVNTISGKFEGKQEYIDSLSEYTLLVIDDLSAERNTEYMNEIVWNIIDARYRSGKPLIVTTNLTAQELNSPAEISKQRVYSRLMEMCIPLEISGKDRRKQKLRDDYNKYASLLKL